MVFSSLHRGLELDPMGGPRAGSVCFRATIADPRFDDLDSNAHATGVPTYSNRTACAYQAG